MAAMGLPVLDREAYVQERCGNDGSLAREVMSLLRAATEQDAFMAAPAADLNRQMAGSASARDSGMDRGMGEQPGDQIGPYTLREVIGEGGFGIVWLAERRGAYVARVALKVLKPGMDSAAIIARFEQERQILAMMSHDHVAKVFDGGITARGRPYFVMEYVKGESITKFCDRHALSIRRRLELFIPVCDAVQHAHMAGVIHRDIKPSNILVGVGDSGSDRGKERDGPSVGRLVKVIDFGVAKAIGPTLSDHTVYTGAGQQVGTHGYMSPEQAEMGPLGIDTRADVYSLGIVLHVLLTGILPIESASGREHRTASPVAPSSRFDDPATPEHSVDAAKRRSTTPGELKRELQQELDWIVLKAIQSDRTLRYDSARELAQDVQRYLAGEPILARPPSRLYLLRKSFHQQQTLWAFVGMFLAMVLLPVSMSCFPKGSKETEDLWSPFRLQLLLPVMALIGCVLVVVSEHIVKIASTLGRKFGAALLPFAPMTALTILMARPLRVDSSSRAADFVRRNGFECHQIFMLLVCVISLRFILRTTWSKAFLAYLATYGLVVGLMFASLIDSKNAAMFLRQCLLGIVDETASAAPGQVLPSTNEHSAKQQHSTDDDRSSPSSASASRT